MRLYDVRILTFSTLYPNAARPTHGIFVETRLRALVASGIVSARVLAPCPWFPFTSRKFGTYSKFARIPRRETRHGIEIDHPRFPLFPKIGMSSAPLGMFAAVLPIVRRQMDAGRDFDVIDAHYFYPDGVAAALLGMAVQRPVVITARGGDLDVISTYAVPRRWIQWAARRAAGLIAVSSGLKRRLERLGTFPDRVLMLRNGVDLSLFGPCEPLAARKSAGFTRPTLLAVGNLVPLKRHVAIVEALPQLSEFDLVIVGDGPERSRIEARARQLGVADRVRLLARMPQERLPVLYSAADFLVHPSEREGWPNVLLESMACGTAVVVSNFDGVTDIVSAPEAGRILAEPTPSCIAETIRCLTAGPPARDMTRRYAEGFDWNSTTLGQIELFQAICERDPSQARHASRLVPS